MANKMRKWNLVLTIECDSESIAESVMKDAKQSLERIYRDIIVSGKVYEATEFNQALELIESLNKNK